jgi:serine/threonine protein kinase
MTQNLRQAAFLPLFLAGAEPAPLDAAPALDAVAVERALEKPASPATFGPYRILREIGSGGMGSVYLAEDAGEPERRVALKLVRSDSYSPAVLQRFDVERAALKSAEHEGVVRFLDAGESGDGRPWLAMEWIEGRPIDAWSAEPGRTLEQRLAIMADAAAAVQHLHERGIVHGDLKPANILVTERDGRSVVKVIDLGLARVAGGGDDGVLRGTPAYIAPELFDLGGATPDERSDVYALGVVLRDVLLAPAPPKPARGLPGVFLSSAYDLPRLSESLDMDALGDPQRRAELEGYQERLRALDRTAARAVSRDPARRFASATELEDALRPTHSPAAPRASVWASLKRAWLAANSRGA